MRLGESSSDWRRSGHPALHLTKARRLQCAGTGVLSSVSNFSAASNPPSDGSSAQIFSSGQAPAVSKSVIRLKPDRTFGAGEKSDPHGLVQLWRCHAAVEKAELACISDLARSFEQTSHCRAIE